MNDVLLGFLWHPVEWVEDFFLNKWTLWNAADTEIQILWCAARTFEGTRPVLLVNCAPLVLIHSEMRAARTQIRLCHAAHTLDGRGS